MLQWTAKDIDEQEAETDLAGLFKALSHPLRVRILRLALERGGCFCGDLADELPVAQSTISQHLKMLSEAGLLRVDVDGTRRCYRVNTGALGRLKTSVGAL